MTPEESQALRDRVLKLFMGKRRMDADDLSNRLGQTSHVALVVIKQLEKDNFVRVSPKQPGEHHPDELSQYSVVYGISL